MEYVLETDEEFASLLAERLRAKHIGNFFAWIERNGFVGRVSLNSRVDYLFEVGVEEATDT